MQYKYHLNKLNNNMHMNYQIVQLKNTCIGTQSIDLVLIIISSCVQVAVVAKRMMNLLSWKKTKVVKDT